MIVNGGCLSGHLKTTIRDHTERGNAYTTDMSAVGDTLTVCKELDAVYTYKLT